MAWEHASGGGGGARYLDVPGAAAPRVRWSVDVPPEFHPFPWSGVDKPRALLLASPRGLVTTWAERGAYARFAVIDPDVGKLRHASPAWEQRPLALCGDHLIVAQSDGVVGLDFGTFEVAWPLTSAWTDVAAHADGLFVVGASSTVTTFRVGPGTPSQLWRADLGAALRQLFVPSSALVVVVTRPGYHETAQLLDGATGTPLPYGNELPGRFWFGDAAGFVGWERQHGMEPGVYDAARVRRFALPEWILPQPLALTPSFVLHRVRVGQRGRVAITRRDTGATHATLPVDLEERTVAAVRDGVYVWEPGGRTVRFYGYDGRRRWQRVVAASDDEIVNVAPLAGRVFVLTDHGRLCGLW